MKAAVYIALLGYTSAADGDRGDPESQSNLVVSSTDGISVSSGKGLPCWSDDDCPANDGLVCAR